MNHFPEFKKVDGSAEYLRQYWDGWSNILVRYWTYFMNGVNVVNEWKYIFVLLGVGVFKSDLVLPWYVLVVGIVIGVPTICLIGRWNIFHANKAKQFIDTNHGNITQFQSHNMQVVRTAMTVAIAEKLGIDVQAIKEELKIK